MVQSFIPLHLCEYKLPHGVIANKRGQNTRIWAYSLRRMYGDTHRVHYSLTLSRSIGHGT